MKLFLVTGGTGRPGQGVARGQRGSGSGIRVPGRIARCLAEGGVPVPRDRSGTLPFDDLLTERTENGR